MPNLIQAKTQAFFKGFPEKQYKKGDVIVVGGRAPAGVMFLSQGLVGMSTVSATGHQLLLTVFKPGSFFPLTWALNQTPNPYDFTALTPVTLHQASSTAVQSWLKQEPEVLYSLTTRILSGLSGLLTQVEQYMRGSASSKLANVLLIEARRFGRPVPEGTLIDFPLTQQLLAAQAAISRETVSRELAKLDKQGLLVKKGRKLIITSIENLESFMIN